MFPVLYKLTSARASSIPLHHKYHVCIVGSANPVGQATALLLRNEPSISNLTLHDVEKPTPGVIFDLYSIPSFSNLHGYCGIDKLNEALKKTDIVIATGGILPQPGVSESTLITANTKFISDLATRISRITPLPILGIAVEPINVMVPFAAEVLRDCNNYDPKQLFGITTSDNLAARAHFATEQNLSPDQVQVPVIGGHCETSLVPLLSQRQPHFPLDEAYMEDLTNRIRKASELITLGKQGFPPVLSVANGIATFVRELTMALDGTPTRVFAMIENNDFGTRFFSGNVSLDQSCAAGMDCYGNLTQFEIDLLEKAIVSLRGDINRGKEVFQTIH